MTIRKFYVKKSNSFFNHDNLLDQYLREIASIPMLSKDEEVAAAKAHDTNKLVKANLRFAVRAAHSFDHMGELTDLIQEANRGLIKAAEAYDPERMHENGRFINYAAHDILAALHTYVRKKNTQLSRDNYYLAAHIANERTRFICNNGEEPSTAYLAGVLGVSEEKVENILFNSTSTIYLEDSVSGDDNGLTWGETVGVDCDADRYTRSSDVVKMVDIALRKYLNPKEEEVLRLTYGIGVSPMSINDIAFSMHLTTTRCNQIKRKALEKIKLCKDLAELF